MRRNIGVGVAVPVVQLVTLWTHNLTNQVGSLAVVNFFLIFLKNSLSFYDGKIAKIFP